MSGWLQPYRVIDLTDERGLLAGQMFARLGADVIQVEPPGGSSARGVAPFDEAGRSCCWSAFAAGKRGITLDLERPEGRRLLLELVARADFLFESSPVGRMAALGLSHEALAARNPALIHVSVTPFGSDGPKAGYADADLVTWASGGPLHPNRDASGPPLRISVPQACLHAAADAAGGALIAHFARLRTGLGQHVEVSVQQSVTQATLGSHLAAAVGHADFTILAGVQARPGPKSLDLSGSGARTRRSKWPVRDGLVEMHLGMGPASGPKSNNLFAWMKAEGALPVELHDWDWRTLPQRILADEINEDHLEFARDAVRAFVARFTKAELMAEAVEREIMLAPVNEIGDLLASPHLEARGFFVEVDEAGRKVTLPGAFAVGPEGMFAEPRGAPALGEHNDAVYGGLLGIDEAQRARLRSEGVL